jgi:hypothetical protein
MNNNKYSYTFPFMIFQYQIIRASNTYLGWRMNWSHSIIIIIFILSSE